jgi:hypothetical protein
MTDEVIETLENAAVAFLDDVARTVASLRKLYVPEMDIAA